MASYKNFNKENGHQITAPVSELAKSFEGYNSTLKPAWEPITLAMKPLTKNYAENAKLYGVSGLNIDGCRTEYKSDEDRQSATPQGKATSKVSHVGAEPDCGNEEERVEFERPGLKGRWPTNVLLDEKTAAGLDQKIGNCPGCKSPSKKSCSSKFRPDQGNYMPQGPIYPDNGGPSRFFYTSKASRSERNRGLPDNLQNDHPTVKPISLNEYLSKLLLPPPRETPRKIMVPFCGSGSEMIGALLAGWDEVIGIEKDEHYVEISTKRLNYYQSENLF